MPTNQQSPNDEFSRFALRVLANHQRVDPCFMTGKGCVYTEVIDRAIRSRQLNHDPATNRYDGFMVMPFRHNLRVFFKNCLTPFLEANYKGNDRLILRQGDEVPRPGVIICEGICKRIQEADFIVADISLPNPNVFYELGLAYGIGHKIIVIHHKGATSEPPSFCKATLQQLQKLGCTRPYEYDDLKPIDGNLFRLSEYIWHSTRTDPMPSESPNILFYDHPWSAKQAEGRGTTPYDLIQDAAKVLRLRGSDDLAEITDQLARAISKEKTSVAQDDIVLEFGTHVESCVGIAIKKIFDEFREKLRDTDVIKQYLPVIEKLQPVTSIEDFTKLDDVRNAVNKAYCLIVRTGPGCHPMSYFWLGYGHARGKNVIPITVIDSPKEEVHDLAFDIRAQRHMTFIRGAPDRLAGELRDTFQQMIESDFSEWSRKHFWDRMVGRRGEVSIFTGALHNDKFNREMIGDWDLRAAAELTAYFGRHQYRAMIETPIYSPEQATPAAGSGDSDKAVRLDRDRLAKYIERLRNMMAGKNCIIIASPDVNPLTEIVLGDLYKVPDKSLFGDPVDMKQYPRSISAFKRRPKGDKPPLPTNRAFYTEEESATDSTLVRGFKSNTFSGESIRAPFLSQVDEPHTFAVHAHLAVMPNPFGGDSAAQSYIIVLNGVSGPATFALTHVLTGMVNKEFVSYSDSFNPEAESERILKLILEHMNQTPRVPLECIVKVEVGPPSNVFHAGPEGSHSDQTKQFEIFDWRRIRSWELCPISGKEQIRSLQ